MTQKRHGDREDFQTKLRVYWQDSNGQDNYAVAQSVDISEKGLSIMIPNHIEARTIVQVKADDHPELCGSASVRFCVRKGMNHNVGLEFSGGAKLKIKKLAE